MKSVQRLLSLYWDGPTPSQDEWGEALDTMEGMVALEKNLNQASWSLFTELCVDQSPALWLARELSLFFFFWYGVAWAVWIFWRLIHLLGNENKNKNEQWDVIKFKSFCKAKETISKKTAQEYGEIFANKGKLDLTLSFLTYKVCKLKKKKSYFCMNFSFSS